MKAVACLAAGVLASSFGAVGGDQLDEVALVQHSASQGKAALEAAVAKMSGVLRSTGKGPMAETRLGPMLGVDLGDHIAFRGIPYAEPPIRFAKALPKQPWVPVVFDARQYGNGCVGSSTSRVESEDCLHLNLWLPRGDHQGLPVIVYFHGGLNMHGSGSEVLRQGDGVVQSADFPVIFVNLDYRLGIFGWIHGEPGENVTSNLGFRDQQMALQWVHDNIEAFGGDPSRVTLMGQSEGAGNIKVHLVSPGSAGLFHGAVFHSPPLEFWTPKANQARTDAIVRKLGCQRSNMLACLRKIPADTLWHADWSAEDMARNVGSKVWTSALRTMLSFAVEQRFKGMNTFLGWHGVADGDVLPGDAQDLIAQGRWNKVPILLTVSRNESLGAVPGADSFSNRLQMKEFLLMFLKRGDYPRVLESYNATLRESGIEEPSTYSLQHQMLTDKIWTCAAYDFAKAVTKSGGSIQLGGFWHAPRFDPVGTTTNKVCDQGATCHAAEMLYSLPQGHGEGIPKRMTEEVAFMESYRDNVLSFVYGLHGPWETYKPDKEVITFISGSGVRTEEGYRKRQCAVLDSSTSDQLPLSLQKQA